MNHLNWSDLNLNPTQIMADLVALIKPLGQKAKEMQSTCRALAKSPKDVITEADHYVDGEILAWIQTHFPIHNYWLEESGFVEQNSNFCWLADPIDGTVNFSRGMPLWGVAVALLYKNEPILGVAYLPALDEMYTTILGKGAFLNGVQISVSKTQDLSLALISNGDVNVGDAKGHTQLNQNITQDWQKEAASAQRVKCFGSAVVEGCFVASGRLDAYIMRLSHPWDIATVSLLIHEAGGKCTQIGSEQFEIKDLCTALMSNGVLHGELNRIFA